MKNSHTIVYLDQMYLSNMAKATLGLMRNKSNSEFWKPLLKELKTAVLANNIACPESEFHGKEASLNSRIERTVIKIINELSWGLQFNQWDYVLKQQIIDAAFRFSRKTLPPRKSWVTAFNSDPQAPVQTRIDDENDADDIYGVNKPMFSSFANPNGVRALKQSFIEQGHEMLRKYSKTPLEWPELLIQSKKGVVDGFMGQRASQKIRQQLQENSAISKLNALENIRELQDMWKRLQSAGINTTDTKTIMPFAESEELLNSPFIDINGSIWAAIGEYHIKGRKSEKSDFYDAPILALVLPYCDVVTTDSFMKEILVNKLQFNKKYSCTIFSASKSDCLSFYNMIIGL
jgi:hypothetical protein